MPTLAAARASGEAGIFLAVGGRVVVPGASVRAAIGPAVSTAVGAPVRRVLAADERLVTGVPAGHGVVERRAAAGWSLALIWCGHAVIMAGIRTLRAPSRSPSRVPLRSEQVFEAGEWQ